MKTIFCEPEVYARRLIELAEELEPAGSCRPKHFMEIMETHKGSAAMRPEDLDEQGLERRNPLIAVLGDSVSAGHFEWAMSLEELAGLYADFLAAPEKYAGKPLPILEVTDSREAYPVRFLDKIMDRWPDSTPNLVNSGIAGDTILGMEKRLERDIISHQPDLVIINGSLNWTPELGDAKVFEDALSRIIRRLKEETKADIILLTPNLDCQNPLFPFASALMERVESMRRLAGQEEVCLVDVTHIWQQLKEEMPNQDISCMLANGINHPGKAGHEAYAKALMHLFDGQD